MVYIPPAGALLPPQAFEGMIANLGQRVSWMRGRTCPCTYASAGPNGSLPLLGTAAKGCKQCFGVGTYWADPSLPFKVYISYMHLSTAPDEPGVDMNADFGAVSRADPTLTIPYTNPLLGPFDPGQPTDAWNNASLLDMFIPVDMLARYTAVLQNDGTVNLPYQQNLRVALSGAVTTWDPVAQTLINVSGYIVSGAAVLLPSGYAPGLNYMVEFQSAPLYVVFRHAGGLPHVRPFGGGTLNEPRRFRLQSLDYWTRQRGTQPQAAGSVQVQGDLTPYGQMYGQPVVGAPVR